MNPEPIEEINKSAQNPTEGQASAKSEEDSSDKTFLYILIAGVSLVLIGALVAYFMSGSNKNDISISDLTITQPFVENNEFKSFNLSNGLKVLLAKSNDGMENSFVSLTVGVGSQTDPKDFVGFTHLIEHLLFTGSRSYPEDDYIVKVINKYNGEDNGVTKSFTTSYYYKIGKGGLEEFSGVLADAVAFPNFDADKIKKELNNVNSEISMRMTFNKNLGYYKVIKKFGNPDARIFRDGFANIDASKQDFEKLHEYITQFHKKYYSANIMTLAIITDEDLDSVKRIVEDNFKIIPDKQIERPTHEFEVPYEPPFNPAIYGNVYYMQGFSKPANLSLVFEVNSERKHHKFHALEFFSFFLNYYSANSLKDILIRQGLITGFDDELTLQDYKRGVYLIQFDLTEKGEKHLSHIILEFFKFLDFIKSLDVAKKIYQEGSNFSKYAFLFNISSEYLMFPEVEQDNFQRVLNFSETLQEFPANVVFTASQIWENFEENRFDEVFLDLDIKKMILMIESENFQILPDDELLPYDINNMNGKNKMVNEADDKVDDFTKKINEGVESTGVTGTNTKLRKLEEISKNLPENSKAKKIINKHTQNLKSSKHVKMDNGTVEANQENPNQDDVKPLENEAVSEDEVDNKHVDPQATETGEHSEKKQVDPSQEHLFKEGFLDTAIDYIKLNYGFDFDNNRKFSFEKIPDNIWEKFNRQRKNSPRKFDPINSLNVEDSMRYDMITNCTLPEDLGTKSGPIEDIKKQTTEYNEVKNPTKEEIEQHQMHVLKDSYKNNMNLVKVFSILFNESTESSVLTQKMLIIRALLVYKICLIDEFDKDDEVIKANLLLEEPRVKNYHKLYRKTLQPKSAVRVMIENPHFQENIIKGSSNDKQLFYLKVELLCLYIKHYLTLNFYKDFVAGNDLSVSSHSYALYFTFIGLSLKTESFVEDMLREMDKLLDPKNYDVSILKNLQMRVINNYSNYSSMTSLKVSTYLLDLMIDELTMDIRSEKNLKQLRSWVMSITPEELAETLSHIQSKNKLTILHTGNVSKKKSLRMSETIKKYLLKDEKDTSIKPTNLFSESINKVLDNMLLRFGNQKHHYMVRVPNLDPEDNNSVYVTYFRSEKETVKVKMMGTMVSHWMRAFVFDKLRNQQNLGYVAYESIREYYYRTGQMILVQGEKFRPNEIESDIEDTIREFFEELKKKSSTEIENLKAIILQNYTEFTNSLEDVTGKLWDFIEEEYILEEKQDYETIATGISLKELIEYYQNTFFKNQKRITLQLYAHELKPEEANFKIDPSKRLIDLDYQIKSLDEMIAMRENSVEKFDRELLQVNSGN